MYRCQRLACACASIVYGVRPRVGYKTPNTNRPVTGAVLFTIQLAQSSGCADTVMCAGTLQGRDHLIEAPRQWHDHCRLCVNRYRIEGRAW